MIAVVRGTLERKGPDHVVVAIGGVSLKVFVPVTTQSVLPSTGEEVRLYTSLQVRDEQLYLYGFATEEGRRLFEMLIGVAGVGPRGVQSLLSALTPQEAALAIASEDANSLSRAPGIGKKTAQRIILELRGKLEKDWEAAALAPADHQADAVTALLALGYSLQEARSGVAGEDRVDLSLEERVRRALQRLVAG